MLKLLSFQPVSLYKNGGASRVLRRLYKGHEEQVYSIGITDNADKLQTGDLHETVISATPVHRPWMRWKVRNLFIWLRNKGFKPFIMQRIRKAAVGVDYDVVHVIHHGPYCMAVVTDEILAGKQLWVSFHDHYTSSGVSFEDTKHLWTKAHRRMAISNELAEEYQRVFGHEDFELITDGVLPQEISQPITINKTKPVIIYFSGLLHIGYYPLFEVLADAMDKLSAQGTSFEFVLRGTQTLSFLANRKFKVDYRRGFISDEEIKAEMDVASILYLPIKFNNPEFYKYSLSTKMVSYLGASGAILYHGPADSAACKRLATANAAINCTTFSVADMVDAINRLIANASQISANAKKQARTEFDLEEIKRQFWQIKNT